MNKNLTRGLALVAITGGFSFLGVTAANAVDLPDLGGGSGGSILDSLRADLPVAIDGLNVTVLDGNGASSLLDDGVFASTNDTTADIFAQLGIDTSGVVDNDMLTSAVGVPVDASNTWLSVLGKEPNGIVVVPKASIPAFAWFAGLVDGFVNAPISISCTSVAVISDFENDCGGTTDVGTGNGDLLDGITNVSLPVDVSDKTVNVLDGDTLDTGTLGGDGVLIDPTDDVIDLSQTLSPDDQLVNLGLPVDATDAWVSVLGENGGIVIVPDSTVDASLLTAGLVDSEILAPISIQCVTITVLSDFARDCAANGEPTDPGDLPTHALPVPDDGVADNGGNGGTGIGDVCPAATTPTAADTASGVDAGVVGGAVLAGALGAIGLMGLGRKFNIL
jgi:hypothetical protein